MNPTPESPEGVATRLRSFHELMQHRVLRVLLVSSLYDSFIMSEEGHLHETLLGHFIDLNLSQTPDLVQVPTAQDALDLLEQDDRFDLIVTSVHAGELNAAQLAEKARQADHGVPIVALAFTATELNDFVSNNDTSQLVRVFLWQGDVRIFLAMVLHLEDRLNAPHDVECCGVPVIIVVEDNIRFYSSFLASIYTEIFRHTQQLLSEGLNPTQRMTRMRARPKVLLSETFEQAWEDFDRYEAQTLGIVSDFEFPWKGKSHERAGLELCKRVAERRPDIRLVMQSSKPENEQFAQEMGASFLLKGSPILLTQLRTTLIDRFGFGDFVFRMPDRKPVDRATDLKSFAEKLKIVPAECLIYHAERNHFANWLKARTEFALAERLPPVKADDFPSVNDLRSHLLQKINDFRKEQHQTIIANFDRKRFEPKVSITRIGGGSLGGKARGVAFANRVLRKARVDEKFPDIEIYVPPSVVLGTEMFDEFMEDEELRDFAIGKHPDREIEQRFVEAPFPRRGISDLRAFLQQVKYPLAVRSSSLLEDSLSQPFAGVYRTFMMPNNELELEMRWVHLSNAIKRVYSSVFMDQAKTYLGMTPFRLEEEKMAVMIQQVIGHKHDDRFYPDFAGVARSYNFYPEPGHAAEDGVVAVGLGMGQTVVGGDPCLRFCPKYPQQLVTFSSVRDALDNSQREFHGLDLGRQSREAGEGQLRRYPLEVAEKDGLLKWLGSTYIPDDNRIVDGISRAGIRLVSFAQILKHGVFPLAELIQVLLDCCSEGTGAPIEIEFAGKLPRSEGEKPLFGFLQMRPMALSKESEEITIGTVKKEDLVCRTEKVLGNGKHDDIRDLVVVDAESFERRKSREVALEVARFDALLRREERPYVLIGVGRWGSSDPSLGIPVGWNQIAGARVIVEAGFKDFKVEPSQGTHFFQNLTSCNVGYFTVNPDAGQGTIDWDWLAGLEAVERTEFVRHLRLEEPVVVKMSGRTGEGVILKP